MRFQPASELQNLIQRVRLVARDAGVEIYVVGGTVRDVLLDRPVNDLDLAVRRDAYGFGRSLASALDAHFVELDDEQPVARVVLRNVRLGVGYIDVAQMHGMLEEDLRRRDFTIDALAVRLGEGEVVDVCGGLADLDRRLVRMNAAVVFEADSVRLLRGARIAAELGFEIDRATEAEMQRRAPGVLSAAAERRRDELSRMFALERTYQGLLLLDRLGLLDALLPEVTFGRGVAQPEQWHAYDVFEHGLRAVEAMDLMLMPARPDDERAWIWDILWETFAWCAEEMRAYLSEEMTERRTRATLLKISALLHDIAKPQTRTVGEDGRVRFFGHADEGALVAARVLRRYRFSAGEVRFVSLLVAEHLRPVQLAQVGEVPTRRALYRFYRTLGDGVPGVLLLALADAAASRGPLMTPDGWRRHVAYMNSLLVRSKHERGIVDQPQLLDGHDVMKELGVPAGPAIGKLLEALREAQAAGEVTDVEGARAFIRVASTETKPAIEEG